MLHTGIKSFDWRPLHLRVVQLEERSLYALKRLTQLLNKGSLVDGNLLWLEEKTIAIFELLSKGFHDR
jgi:hypothetical protein